MVFLEMNFAPSFGWLSYKGRKTFPFMVMLQKLDFLRQMDVIQTNTLFAGYTGWRLAKNITNLPSSFAMNSMVHFGIRWEVCAQKKGVSNDRNANSEESPYDWYACPSEYSKSTMIKAGSPENKITVIPHED